MTTKDEFSPTLTSTEALAGLLLVLGVANTSSTTDALTHGCLDALPAAQELGMTEHGWRPDAMLRALYGALTPAHRELVDGDALGFPAPLWGMMTGEIVSL